MTTARSEAPVTNRWKAISVCYVASFMVLLDVSIVNVALPSIQSGLDASDSALQWVLSGYALAFGLTLVPAGRLGDARGRRTIFMVGLALFVVASVACGLAPNALVLSVARLLQGAAGGFVTPQSAGFIQELFAGRDRGKAFGMLGAVIGVSTAVGPLLGGAILAVAGEEDGWRWIFFVNVPVGVVALVLARRLLPAPVEGPKQSLDPVGVLLLGLGLLLVLLPLVEARTWPLVVSVSMVPAAALVLWAFVRWERRHAARGREPLVLLDLFRVRSYLLGTIVGAVYFAGFTSIFFTLTLFLQSGLGYSPLAAGVAITPFALASAVSSALGGRVVTRTGRGLVAAGLAAVILGLAAAAVVVRLVDGAATGWAVALPLVVAGLGSGLVIAPNQTLTLAEVPLERAGSAAAVVQMGQRVGTALGIAVVGAAFFAMLAATDDWVTAFETGLVVSIVLVAVALAVAVLDLRRPRTPPRAR